MKQPGPFFSLMAVAAAAFAFIGIGSWLLWTLLATTKPPLPEDISDPEVRATLDRARARLEQSISDGKAWGDYGTVLLANLFDQPADFCFIEAMKRDPGNPRWPYARGQIALKRQPELAIAFLEKAAQVARSRPLYRQAFVLTLAEALLEKGETDQAEIWFNEQLCPPDPERARFGLGLVAMAKGDHATATRFFEEAAKHPSCRKQAKAQLAFLARSRGDLITARQLESESALLEQDPPWPDPYLDMVVTLQAGNRGAQRRIALLERDGKYAEALEASFEVLALKRTSQALTGVGINLARLRRYQEAIPFLAEAVQVDPNDSNAHYTLALVLFTQWEISVAGGPVGADAASGFRQVIEHSKKTLALKPDHARACLFWGLAHKHLGENAEAIAPLRRGLSVEPQMFDLHLALGQVLAATGDTNGAKASLATAKQLRPADPRPDTELSRIK